MTPEQKKAEIQRICQSPGINKDTRAILSWLWTQTEEDPLYRCDSTALFLNAIATRLELKDWESKSTDAKLECRNSTRRIVLDAREYIKRFYKTEKGTTGVEIALPIGLNKTEPSRKGAYGLRFIEAQSEAAIFSGGNRRKMRPSEFLWNKLLTIENGAKALLVYPADPITLRNRHVDDRGLTSGSGEVAGAFVIAGSMGEMWRRFELRRSCDVTPDDLRSASYLLLLGSSIKNKVVREFREELLEDAAWPNQTFLFRELRGADGKMVGAICKGEISYPYSVTTLRSHETDYALISYFRHISGERFVVALQGISTVATRAAAEFLATDSLVKDLLKKLKLDPDKPLPSFEIVLEVSVRGYRPVQKSIRDYFIHPDVEPSENS